MLDFGQEAHLRAFQPAGRILKHTHQGFYVEEENLRHDQWRKIEWSKVSHA
jgi:hypothetical protein